MSEHKQPTASQTPTIATLQELPSSLSTPGSAKNATDINTAHASPTTTTTTTTESITEVSPQPSLSKVTKPKKKSKKLCHYKNCSNPHSIIGDCSFCFKKFCTRHRLLEAHDCEHYREVRNNYHERNARQLESQQTVVSKV